MGFQLLMESYGTTVQNTDSVAGTRPIPAFKPKPVFLVSVFRTLATLNRLGCAVSITFLQV